MVYEEYEERLRSANALDFDDLLLEAVRLLRHDAGVREAYNRRIRYLMIDEYQDTNRSQYELMRLLTSHRTATSAWSATRTSRSTAGAAPTSATSSISSGTSPTPRVIRLEQNYRSTKNILEAAGAVVANNIERKGKWLWTESGGKAIR